VRVFYSDDYVAISHAIDATRKPQWIADSLRHTPIPGVQLMAPSPAAEADLRQVHTPEYLLAVQTGEPRALAETSTFPWDPGVWTAELASCGGMIAAARCALDEGMSGSLSCGFHHARRERGWGHCTFNGLALATVVMRQVRIERILCIDLDAHCGGGTYSLVGTLPAWRQLDVSLFPTDRYRPTLPSTLDIVESSNQYLDTLQRRLDGLPTAADFQLCLYYAGMDPHEGSAFGGLPGLDARMLRQRDQMVFAALRQCKIPCAFAVGGGYLGPGLDREGLVALHRATIELATAVRP
jgi:acetoin utilization deacetylase AcuC-like enzyme